MFGEGEKAESAPAGIQASYDKEVTDEFVGSSYGCDEGRRSGGNDQR